MNIRRFFGKNAREALAQVKQALGDDAIIIANRSVNGGTEIMAMLETDVATTPGQATAETSMENSRSLLDFVNAKDQPRQASPQTTPVPATAATAQSSEEAAVNESAIMDMLKQHSEQQEQAYQVATQTLEDKMMGMMQEMRQMRSHFETQMSAMTWQHHLQHSPAKSKVLSTLLSASFSAALSRQIAEKMPNHIDVNKAPMWAKEVISRNLHTLDDEDALLDRGGIYALVGQLA